MGLTVTGTVSGGNRIGRLLGFPTANIRVDDSLQARDGVYMARVTIDGQSYDAMANIGRKPSFGPGPIRMLEVNIFRFNEIIYGMEVTVELLDFIRAERAFRSMDNLRDQIRRDKRIILAKFGHPASEWETEDE